MSRTRRARPRARCRKWHRRQSPRCGGAGGNSPAGPTQTMVPLTIVPSVGLSVVATGARRAGRSRRWRASDSGHQPADPGFPACASARLPRVSAATGRHARATFSSAISATRPGLRLEDATGLLIDLAVLKSVAEIAILRECAEMTNAAVAAFLEPLRLGVVVKSFPHRERGPVLAREAGRVGWIGGSGPAAVDAMDARRSAPCTSCSS